MILSLSIPLVINALPKYKIQINNEISIFTFIDEDLSPKYNFVDYTGLSKLYTPIYFGHQKPKVCSKLKTSDILWH